MALDRSGCADGIAGRPSGTVSTTGTIGQYFHFVGTLKSRSRWAKGQEWYIVPDSSIGQGTVQRSNCYGSLRDDGVTKLIASIDRRIPDLSGGALSWPAGYAAWGTPE